MSFKNKKNMKTVNNNTTFILKTILLLFFLSTNKVISQFTTYSFYDTAPLAKWESSVIDKNSNALPNTTTALTFAKSHGENGKASITTSILENNRSHKILFTHPKWKKNGTIKGWLPPIKSLPENATFSSSIGFVKPNSTAATDGVRFMVYLHYYINGKEQWKPIIDEWKNYTGKLQHVSYNLAEYAGQKVFFELRVDAGESSGQDWAAWVNPKVTGTHTSATAPKHNKTFYTETVTLERIKDLCPNSHVGGDFEFGGNGPKVFGSITLWRGENNKHIYAHINFNAQETHHDVFSGGRSEVKGYWEIPVYTAPPGKKINGIITPNVVTKFEKVLKGGGANELFGGGDGSPHTLTIGNGLDGKGYVTHFKVVGDTGGWDISRDNDCTNDTRILDIKFKPIEVQFFE